MGGTTQSLTAGERIGNYQITGLIGAGGMGVVYKAVDLKLERTVALKFLPHELSFDANEKKRFLQEARAASALDHSNIGVIHGVEESADGRLFIVMAYYEGGTLTHRVVVGALPPSQAVDIAIQVALGLAEAHARNIVHRDIKPSNIIITRQNQVKIVDFGLARVLTASATQSLSGTGTAAYMAPEQVLGKPLDARTDLWALGVVLAEMLTGRHPFKRDSVPAVTFAIVNQPPDHMDAVPSELQPIVLRALSKDPAHRYQSAAEFLSDLRQVRALLPATSWDTPSAAPPVDHSAATIALSSKRMKEYARHASTPSWAPLAAAPRPHWKRWLLAAPLVIVVALLAFTGAPTRVQRWMNKQLGVKPQQLAVVPFTAADGDASAQAFAAGLTESISSRLGGGPDESVQVIPSSEIRNQKVDSVDKARQQFGVDLVLTGSLRESGNLVRVSYSLIDARTRRQLHGDTLTVTAGDPFALEDQVMASLSRSLRLQPQRASAHGTSDSSAYVYYLRGRGYLQDYTRPENLDAALAAFKNALDRDPNYALAYAGLGQTYWHKFQEMRDTSQVGNATMACERALAIDPKLSEAHICLGTAYTHTGKYDDAIQQFQQALGTDAANDDAVRGLGFAFEKAGRFGDAEKTFREAIKLRPHYWANYNLLGAFYWRRGRYDEAGRAFHEVIYIAPDNDRGYNNLAGVYIMQGKYADAIPLLERCVAIRPNPSGFANLG
ncbi:MAG: protein kinase, partial [Acidobacteriaceae bacterium]|nr:protein kinase [Acidobacteriaceae bacterium]